MVSVEEIEEGSDTGAAAIEVVAECQDPIEEAEEVPAEEAEEAEEAGASKVAKEEAQALEAAEEIEEPAKVEEKEDPWEVEREAVEAAIAEAKAIRPKMGNAKGKKGCPSRRAAAGDAAAEVGGEFLDAEDEVDEEEAEDPELQVPALSQNDIPAEMARLEALDDDEAKVQQLLEALSQRVDDTRKLEDDQVVKNRRVAAATRERDRLIGEVSRTRQATTKLETSGREFQARKASIGKENVQIADEERNRHKELQEKFDQAMKDVQEKMDAELEVRSHFVKENEELGGKLQKFTETYEEQERQLAEQRESREAEMGVATKQLREHEAMCAKSKVKADGLEKHNEVLRKSQTILRAELQSILNKFDECHVAVTGSNERHGECKVEIDSLQTRLQGLEKEHANLRSGAEVAVMLEEHKVAQKQRDALEKLCSNLHREIKQLEN